MLSKEEIQKYRQAQYTIGPLFLNRWSPRAMSGEEISMQMMFSLFEAARWAPSSNNNQPWRFLWSRRGTDHWDRFFDFLSESNKLWARNAAVLIVAVSKTTFDYNGKPARTHSFDTGAAWENIALQGTAMGLVVHGMQGFSYSRAKDELRVPEGYQVEAMIAVGQPGRKEDLPEEVQAGEYPSDRKKVAEIAFEGKFEAPGD